jgi:hypothetical protein
MRAPVDWRDTGREPREEWRARLPAGCTCRNCGRPWDAKQKRANYWMWVIGEEATCDGNPLPAVAGSPVAGRARRP